ncbi:TauD/TfdA dioxygenase family protein [Litorivivens sp.]|uniref:TauD/TfdA dioxygenase family protein n=1 Tax=Litorivivens sp. TaxID=2020868 RepID=UPI003566E5C6
MRLIATPLKDDIGMEIHADIDTLLSPEVGAQLRKLLIDRGVLVFRTLNPGDEQQLALAGNIGTLRQEQGRSIYKITLDKNQNANADYLKGSWLWHLDGTHDRIPPFATMLSGKVLSETGGQTEFANSYAAYETLSDEMKRRIENLKVVHSVETSMHRAGIAATDHNLSSWRSNPNTTHRLVWEHTSGRKSLVIGCHADHIVGMDRKESDALLKELLDWATQPRFVYRHEWTVGDLLIWDNTGVLHRAEPYPLDSGRVMHRCTLLGEEAFSH